jgi:hypothetical protein
MAYEEARTYMADEVLSVIVVTHDPRGLLFLGEYGLSSEPVPRTS